MTTIEGREPQDNADHLDVGISLKHIYKEERNPDISECNCDGIGALLRDEKNPAHGRAIELAAKSRDCPYHGRVREQTRCRNILQDFKDVKMHAIEVVDGSTEWATLQRDMERHEDLYHRVPAPDGKAVTLTTAEVGDLVTVPGAFVKAVLAAQPHDRRRVTSSGAWKDSGDRRPHRWKRVGTTHKPQAQRVEVYTEEGCNPREALVVEEDVRTAHDVDLPDQYSEAMLRLVDRLDLVRDDPVPEDMNPWDKALWFPTQRQRKGGGRPA